jgi:hypothetical protein
MKKIPTHQPTRPVPNLSTRLPEPHLPGRGRSPTYRAGRRPSLLPRRPPPLPAYRAGRRPSLPTVPAVAPPCLPRRPPPIHYHPREVPTSPTSRVSHRDGRHQATSLRTSYASRARIPIAGRDGVRSAVPALVSPRRATHARQPRRQSPCYPSDGSPCYRHRPAME